MNVKNLLNMYLVTFNIQSYHLNILITHHYHYLIDHYQNIHYH